MIELQNAALRVGDTSISYPDFTVRRGSRVLLRGPNGSGKTLLLDVLSGFVSLQHGKVCLELNGSIALPSPRFFRMGLGRSFQHPRFVSRLTVDETLGLASRASDKEARRRLLYPLGIRGENLVGALSYGQQRAIGIVAALTQGQELCLLDEPLAGMHSSLREPIFEEIARRTDTTFLICEHSQGVDGLLGADVVDLAAALVSP